MPPLRSSITLQSSTSISLIKPPRFIRLLLPLSSHPLTHPFTPFFVFLIFRPTSPLREEKLVNYRNWYLARDSDPSLLIRLSRPLGYIPPASRPWLFEIAATFEAIRIGAPGGEFRVLFPSTEGGRGFEGVHFQNATLYIPLDRCIVTKKYRGPKFRSTRGSFNHGGD